MPHPDSDLRSNEPDPWEAFLRRAEALWDARRFDLILELAGRHLALHGDSPDLQGWISFAAVAAGRPKEGIAAAEARVRADPTCPQAHGDHGKLLRCVRDDDAAEAAFRRSLALNPVSAEFRGRLADLLLDAGQAVEGLAEARRALEIDPRHVQAYIAAVRGLIETEELTTARTMLEAAPAALVGTARFHALRGDLLRYDRKTTSAAAAAEAFTEALRLDPQWREARERGLYAALEARPIYPAAAVLTRLRRGAGRFAEFFWLLLIVGCLQLPPAACATTLVLVVLARHAAEDAHVSVYWMTLRRGDLRRLVGRCRLQRRLVSGLWRCGFGLASAGLAIVAIVRHADIRAAMVALAFGLFADAKLLRPDAMMHAEGGISTRWFGGLATVIFVMIAGLMTSVLFR